MIDDAPVRGLLATASVAVLLACDVSPNWSSISDDDPVASSAHGASRYQCMPVGQSTGDGFFSLQSYDGYVYAGQFGYGLEHQSMVFRYPAWERVTPGLAGISESVCALLEHDGYLYANTESDGHIFRSADGTTWERVYGGSSGTIGCGLAELNGVLYAINYDNSRSEHGRVLRFDGSRWTVVYDSGGESLYLREIAAFRGALYAFGVVDGRQPVMLVSRDGATWSREATPARFFRAHVWKDALWLTSTSRGTAIGHAGVWRYDGDGFDAVHRVGATYATDIVAMDDRLFVATSAGWKGAEGGSALLMSPNGVSDWQVVCQFDETAAWDMTVLDDTLYVGTWDYGHGGSVYQVTPQPQGVCAPRAGALARGRAHVVTPDAFTGDEATTQPKTDANDGRNGDNPEFRRHNVARAHADYWYSSNHQEAGEPDPRGPQWVDYTPDFDALGVGCYEITARYRATENRANYEVSYQILDSWDGDVSIADVQRSGGGEYVDVPLGQHQMCPGSFVRIEDPGPRSISFNALRFVYVGGTCTTPPPGGGGGGGGGDGGGGTPADCTTWDFSAGALCPAGTYNCDCANHCGATAPCDGGGGGGTPTDCTTWDFSAGAPCPAGTYNCDCANHCGATAPCDGGGGGGTPTNCTTWDFSAGAPCPAGTYNCDCANHCGATAPCGGGGGGGGGGGVPADCTTWDFSAGASCPAGRYNCDCSGHCGATAPCN